MTDTRFKIVFSGELMPAAALDTVKDNLARLFKSDLNKIEALFTGNPVALKRDLSDAEADKYVGALQHAGAKVYKEHDLSASLSLVETDDHRTTPVEPDETARMTCPKCGHEQAKGIECSACGIVIEKYLTRQAQLAAEAAANPPPAAAVEAAPGSLLATLASADGAAASPYATPRAQMEDSGAVGELNYFGVAGRIGRVRFLGWWMGVTFLNALVGGALGGGLSMVSPILGGGITIVLSIVALVLSVFFTGKRLHDMGGSAWLTLLLIVPLVNIIFILVLLIVSGTKGPNRYGPPPPPNGTGLILLACIMPIVMVIGILAAVAIPAYQEYRTRAQEAQYEQPSADMAEPAEAVQPAEPGEPVDEASPNEE